MFSFFLFHKKQMFLLIIVGEKCHVTLWLNPLSRVSFGDTVATPKKKRFSRFFVNGHLEVVHK